MRTKKQVRVPSFYYMAEDKITCDICQKEICNFETSHRFEYTISKIREAKKAKDLCPDCSKQYLKIIKQDRDIQKHFNYYMWRNKFEILQNSQRES